MVSSWLSTPDVAAWYEDPDYIEDLEDHLEDDRIRQQIVMAGDTPFAYVQDYDIHRWTGHHLGFLPAGSRGLDTFIGTPDMLGKGYGAAYLRTITDSLLEDGIPALGIDPNANNTRAIRAYQKIGFAGDKVMETEWGSVRLLSLFANTKSA